MTWITPTLQVWASRPADSECFRSADQTWRNHVCILPTAVSPSIRPPHSAVLQKEINVWAQTEKPESLSSSCFWRLYFYRPFCLRVSGLNAQTLTSCFSRRCDNKTVSFTKDDPHLKQWLSLFTKPAHTLLTRWSSFRWNVKRANADCKSDIYWKTHRDYQCHKNSTKSTGRRFKICSKKGDLKLIWWHYFPLSSQFFYI